MIELVVFDIGWRLPLTNRQRRLQNGSRGDQLPMDMNLR